MEQIKTPEEILQHHYVHDRGLNNPEYVVNAMKEYARQAVIHTLTAASEKAKMDEFFDQRDCSSKYWVDKSSILNLKEEIFKELGL